MDSATVERRVKCLGCGAWFRDVRELRAEDWRHDGDCKRLGEVWK
jgi:hypothetical protein